MPLISQRSPCGCHVSQQPLLTPRSHETFLTVTQRLLCFNILYYQAAASSAPTAAASPPDVDTITTLARALSVQMGLSLYGVD
eukprot:1725025-Rhodomonas_salina.1